MVKVCMESVLHKGKFYKQGEQLPALPEEDEARLISQGICVPVEKGKKPKGEKQTAEDGPNTSMESAQ